MPGPFSQHELEVDEISVEERRETRIFGMWMFLGSEVMFFTAFFAAYIVIRSASSGSIVVPLNRTLGAINTAVLITSSLTMVLAVMDSKKGKRLTTMHWLLATFLLGALFMVLKGVEYAQHFRAGEFPSTDVFHASYYLLTGFHALHVLGGMIAITALWFRTKDGAFNQEFNDPIEVTGLYWHFVDIVWIFLFPALYLV